MCCNCKDNKNMRVKDTADNKGHLDSAFIYTSETDTPGIILLKNGGGCGYLDINYCPICGRDLRIDF